MDKITYVGFKKGYHAKIKADVAYLEVERIRNENNGDINPKMIAIVAKDKTNPLHPQIYDKNKSAAANAYYENNARGLLKSIVIVTEKEEGKVEPTRAYVSVVSEDQQSNKAKVFTSTREALTDPVRRDYVLAMALGEFASMRKKYAGLSELACIWVVLDDLAMSM